MDKCILIITYILYIYNYNINKNILYIFYSMTYNSSRFSKFLNS